MSKPRDEEDKPIEHQNWKILLNTEVREVTWNSDKTRAIGVKVKAPDGTVHKINLKDPKNAEDPCLRSFLQPVVSRRPPYCCAVGLNSTSRTMVASI